MDNNKKQQNYSRTGNAKTSHQSTDSSRQKTSSSDIQSTKYWTKNSRRRENPSTSARNNNNNNNSKQSSAKIRPNVDKRPRARGYNNNNNNGNNAGGSHRDTNKDNFTACPRLGFGELTSGSLGAAAGRFEQLDCEVNSVYTLGIKKQNLNHLLNFYYTPREIDYYDGVGGSNSGSGNGIGNHQRRGISKKHKYNKEQFLQANFQFVIKASSRRKTDVSPDTLIDWSLIEQINIQTPDEPQCPICLYPPVAAKVTRCGHVYCWSCILHYLSLSDKTWRKCPICYEAIHVGDLKSALIFQQQSFNVNSQITFRLMRRKKGSLYIEKHDGMKVDKVCEKYPYVCSPLEEKLFSKFILAKRNDVTDILEREQKELLTDVDESCPEYVYIKQALNLLKERSEMLNNIEEKEVEKENLYEVFMNNKQLITMNNEKLSNNEKENNESKTIKESLLNTQSNVDETSESISNEDNAVNNPSTSISKSAKFYYFYQSDDGQNIYLHPLNVKMLQACYGGLADCPTIIHARILQKEQHSMDEDLRRKFTCLGHLPLTCQFSVVEIELKPPYVTEGIIQAFKADILFRKRERQRRAREEREREKHIDAINDRQMGKFIANTANINILSSNEFPTCGFEEPLSPPDNEVDNIASTSKGSRIKTISTSSAGSCSYSAIAIRCQKGNTPWSTLNAANLIKHGKSATCSNAHQLTSDCNETSILSAIHTNLGDVLAQALSQKEEMKSTKSTDTSASSKSPGGGNKKSKKPKKMHPLYSTGMNFSGN